MGRYENPSQFAAALRFSDDFFRYKDMLAWDTWRYKAQ
jgi:hypothetical protein